MGSEVHTDSPHLLRPWARRFPCLETMEVPVLVLEGAINGALLRGVPARGLHGPLTPSPLCK